MELSKKIALVTGGARGIGAACVFELLKNGVAHVAVLDLASSNGEDKVRELNENFGNGRAMFIASDVTKSDQIEAAFDKTLKEFGGLDIVINNAGVLNDAQWELMLDVNVGATIRGILLGFKHMGKENGKNGGTIVNIASVAGLRPVAALPIYCATKHAVIGLSRSFAEPYHYDRNGVRILVLCPGATDTQMVANCSEHPLDMVKAEFIAATFAAHPSQTKENVAQGMIEIIRKGKNGSVWIVSGAKPVTEYQFSSTTLTKALENQIQHHQFQK